MDDRNAPQPRMRAGDADRDHVLRVVQQGYEEGRLDLDEFRDRQEKVLRAKFTDELPRLIDDLPGAGLAKTSDARPEVRRESLPPVAPADGGFSVTVMSGRDVVVESGTRELSDIAWWGGNNYDLTRAMGPGRIVTLNLHAIMAGHSIFVPEGVRVIDQSIAIMAGNGVDSDAQGDGSNGTLVIKGFLWWAGHDVKLRHS